MSKYPNNHLHMRGPGGQFRKTKAMQPTPAELEAVQEIATQLGFEKLSPAVSDKLTRILAAHRDPAQAHAAELDKLQDTCQKLISYRDRAGALNFQLEKADDFINQMRALLAVMP